MSNTRKAIGKEPSREPDNMHPYKGHAAADVGDDIGYAICVGSIGFGCLFQFQNRLHIPLGNVLDGTGRVKIRRRGTGLMFVNSGHRSC